MHLGRAVAAVVESAKPEHYETFRRHIDRAWIEEALAATGTATLRRRRLPAEQVVWLVIGMALFRDRPIIEVANKLDLALPAQRGPTAAPSSVAQARQRLGQEPLEWLFLRCAHEWAFTSAKAHAWRGLALYGVDATTLRVPDTSENRRQFGTLKGPGGIESAYPIVRIAVLMALRSHLLCGVSMGPCGVSEGSYATELWSSVPDHSLTLVDRGLSSAAVLIPLSSRGDHRHWLTRAKKNTQWKVLRKLGPHDLLIERPVSEEARRRDPSLPSTWVMRAIRYQRRGFKPQVLLTSLLDPILYPRDEVVRIYHERWEIELGYDEIKTDILDSEATIRSQTPAGVLQELWAVLLVYNLVRREMEQMANEAGVEPTRISFVAALRLIHDELLWCAIASPGAIPRHLANLRRSLKLFILPPRRQRTYDRVVKLKSTNYRQKPRRTDA